MKKHIVLATAMVVCGWTSVFAQDNHRGGEDNEFLH